MIIEYLATYLVFTLGVLLIDMNKKLILVLTNIYNYQQ